jgi:hypothetical protein
VAVLDKFRIVASEFANLADQDVLNVIQIAEPQLALSIGGANRETLIAYLTAHILTLARRKMGATGEIASMSEGGISIEFQKSTAKLRNSLSTTTYGQEFDRLCRPYIFTIGTRNQNAF